MHGVILCVLGTVDHGSLGTAFIGKSPCGFRGEIICLDPDLDVHSITAGRG